MIRVCTRRATSRALGRVAGSAAQHLSISRRRPGGQSLQPPEALLLWLPPLVLCGKHPSAELSKLPVGTSLVPLPWDLWPEPPCCHLVHHQVLSSPSRSPVLIWAPTGEALPAASQSAGRRIGFGPQDATLGGGGSQPPECARELIKVGLVPLCAPEAQLAATCTMHKQTAEVQKAELVLPSDEKQGAEEDATGQGRPRASLSGQACCSHSHEDAKGEDIALVRQPPAQHGLWRDVVGSAVDTCDSIRRPASDT